jgi:ABC-type transport system involved in cytochrome c biogenesis permease subunit
MAEWRRRHSLAPVLVAALINLNHPATYVHAGFFQMSVSNVVVIGLMIVVFVAAIALPFRRRDKGPQR